MNLKKLLSSKHARRIQIVAAGVSATSLLFATWVSTLTIPRIQNVISGKDSTVSKLRGETISGLVQGLYARDDYTDRRIDFLDGCLEASIWGNASTRKRPLLESAVDKTIDQIKQWDSLFISDASQPISTRIPILDESASAEQKLVGLDPILSRAKQNAYTRLSEVGDQIRKCESEKAKLEHRLNRKQACFKFFQIFGLFLLGLAVVLESYHKYRGVTSLII